MANPIPPGIALTLTESAKRRTPETLAKLTRDRGFRKELKDQCSVAADFYVDGSAPIAGDFNVYAAGGLSPFSTTAKCCEISCRIAHAEVFARSTCLYAETVIAPDGFSSMVAKASPSELLTEMAVLQTLAPLIDSGVIRFAPSVSGRCTSCLEAITGTFDSVENALWNQVADSFEFMLEGHGGREQQLIVSSPFDSADGTRITMELDATKEDLRDLPIDRWVRGKPARIYVDRHAKRLHENLRSYVSELLFDASVATPAGAVIGTNYRLGAAALRVIDGKSFSGLPIEDWEELRSVPLPWVKKLTAAEVARLRDEAAPALPAFRQRMQRELIGLSAAGNDDQRTCQIAIELRHEALDLQEKLRTANVSGVRRTPNLLGGLGFAVGFYGLGTADPTAALAGLGIFATTIASAHRASEARRHELAALKQQPAYVLLTARHIHAGH